jgi:UDP-N-acetylmuramoyl-tripeptide--D-alanyl-D-alanine ligase
VTQGFWTLDRVHEALGSGPGGARSIHAISTDTRTLQRGDLFVALRGERFDAHDYLPEAVALGAAGLVVHHIPRGSRLGVPIYAVSDTLVALGQLATYWRAAWGKPVIAIAGSNGKTTTKDITAAALSTRYAVHATAGTLNNRVGVPLTLLSAPPSADLAVVEVGTSLPGEVAILRDIVRPEIAVVTSVAEEHLEGLGDLAGVLREESSIYDGVELGIAPAAQPEVVREARARARTAVAAGLDDGDFRAASWRVGADALGEIEIEGVVVRPPIRGTHTLRNAMLSLAVARACGVSMEDATRGIQQMPAPKMRAAWLALGRARLINDAYNANPGSTRAAFELLRASCGSRQRVIVLGTMRELGPRSEALHEEIAQLAVETGDVVAGVGEFASALNRIRANGVTVVTASDVDELWPALEPHLAPDALILLKASRGVRLERMVPYLEAWAAKAT